MDQCRPATWETKVPDPSVRADSQDGTLRLMWQDGIPSDGLIHGEAAAHRVSPTTRDLDRKHHSSVYGTHIAFLAEREADETTKSIRALGSMRFPNR